MHIFIHLLWFLLFFIHSFHFLILQSAKYKLKQESDVKIPHPEIDGIFDIEYRVEYEKMDYTGKRGTGKYNTLPPERRPPYNNW